MAALLTATAATSAAFAGDPDLLFYASYDHGLDAEVAVGTPTALGVALITRGGQGFRGEALIAQHGFVGVELYTGVKYLLAGNLRREEGSIEFYVKPLPGFLMNATGTHWRRIMVCTFDKQVIENERLYRWFRIDFSYKAGHNRLRFFEQDMHNEYSHHIQVLEPRLAAGVWYHIAYCWRGKRRTVHLNGKLLEDENASGTFPETGVHLTVGGGPHGAPQQAANALIDELRIWRSARYIETPPDPGL